jgi:hypothetical protein
MVADVIGAIGEVDHTFSQEIRNLSRGYENPGPSEPGFIVPKHAPNIDPRQLARGVSTIVYSPVSMS